MSAPEPRMVPLPGGHSGETFLAEMAGERTVVRIYARRGARRSPEAVEVDAALLRLVRGLLPVPEVLEVRREDGATGSPALLVTSFLPGERLEEVLPAAPEHLRRAIGEHLGVLLARLALIPTLRAGEFLDRELRIGPMPPAAAGLPEWVEHHRGHTALRDWDPTDLAGLTAVAETGQRLLDRIDRSCLVHSDFNAKNVLVDPGSGAVTGLVDWEFAHSGLPVTDLGNLLRFERDPVLTDAVLGVYADRVPEAQQDLLDLARAADLFGLVELAGRRSDNRVTERARARLLAIARSGDLHAVD